MSNLSDVLEYVQDFANPGSYDGGAARQEFLYDRDASKVVNYRVDKLHPSIQPYAMMTKTCYMEFDPLNPRGRVPGIYARTVGPVIGRSIFLQDKNENQVQVTVERENGEIFFTHGWSRMRDFYGIGGGAWVTLLFITPFIFHIRLRDITGVEIVYPLKNPPHRLLLSKPFGEGPSKAPVPYFVLPPTFSHRLDKTLTAADVDSGTLTLYWGGFYQNAFPKEETQLTLVDWLGNMWNQCRLSFDNGSDMTCKIDGQWRNICNLHNLVKGVTVKFGVTDASNNKTVYFKLSPFLGVKTTLIDPSTSSSRKAFYQTQHYYML